MSMIFFWGYSRGYQASTPFSIPPPKEADMLHTESIKKLQPKEKMYKEYDADGLYLAVMPSGKKSFRFKYRFQGKEKSLTFGLFPTVTLSVARDRTVDARRLLAAGVDPSEAKKTRQNAFKEAVPEVVVTFRDVALEVVAQKILHCTEQYALNYKRSLELHVFPLIGDRAIADLKSGDILDAVKKASAAGSYLPHKLTERISEVFDHAVMTERREYNPVNKAITKSLPAHKEVSHRAISESQIVEFYGDLIAYRGFPLTKIMIEFTMHVFLRTGEVRRLEWAHIDMNKRIIDMPSGREINMKNAPLVPISDTVLKLLLKAREIVGEGNSALVFPMARDFARPASENVITAALRSMGWTNDMTGHGFRALARTSLEEPSLGGFDPNACELQLGHSIARSDTEGSYRRVAYWDERVQMMRWWSEFLDAKKAEALARI